MFHALCLRREEVSQSFYQMSIYRIVSGRLSETRYGRTPVQEHPSLDEDLFTAPVSENAHVAQHVVISTRSFL